MPADPLLAGSMVLSTDFPLDKVIYMVTGSVAVAGTDFADVVIPHHLPFTPLMDGRYSTSPSFADDFDIGSGEPFAGTFGFFAISTSIDADASNVNLHIINYTPTAETIYYRLFGLMPSNVNAEVDHTANLADVFQFNTDFNYTKLLLAQRYTSTTTITHGLARRPQVALWHELIGVGIYKTIYADINNPFTNVLCQVTSQTVQVQIVSGSYAAHVRIYVDE